MRSSRGPIHRAITSPTRPIASSSSLLIQTTRPASTAAAGDARSLVARFKNLLFGTSLTLVLAFGYLYATDTRAGVHQWLSVPTLRYIFPDAEDAHHFGTRALKTLYALGLSPRERRSQSEEAKGADLSVVVFGHKLQNPLGTSAGIDKLGEVPDPLFELGPAVVEAGGVTPLPQEGNPKPRVWRVPSQRGLVNRYGLNSRGADDMARRLRERVRVWAVEHGFGAGEEGERRVLDGEAGVPAGSLREGKMLLVQVAKNKDTKGDDIEAVRRDYVYCVERLAPYADVLVVNVSSPNTAGLRDLQKVEPLTRILEGVVGAARSCGRKTPPKVMVKVSPDEDKDEQIEGIVQAIWKSGVDGVIVGNTTNRRANLLPANSIITETERKTLTETGGYSGPQMFERTLSLVKRYRALLDDGPPAETSAFSPPKADPKDNQPVSTIVGKLESAKDTVVEKASDLLPRSYEQKVIFATGGITNGKQALQVLNAGASVAQIYTGLIYGGLGTVTRMKREMRDEMTKKK